MGQQQAYHPNGNLAMSFNMNKGNLQGILIHFNEIGSPIIKQIYHDGALKDQKMYEGANSKLADKLFTSFLIEMSNSKSNSQELIQTTLSQIYISEENYTELLQHGLPYPQLQAHELWLAGRPQCTQR